MMAAETLRTARTAGIEIGLAGDDLVLEATSPPPQSVLDALSRNKVGIVALLRPGDDGWSAEDWHAYFGERAGIIEFDGGLTRSAAEARAFAYCVTEWLNRHPATSSPQRCLACGGGGRQGAPLLPHGTVMQGYAWLHARCWPGWHASRKGEAVDALLAMGIKNPPTFPNGFGQTGNIRRMAL